MLAKATSLSALVVKVGEDAPVISRLEDTAAADGRPVDLVALADDPSAWVGPCAMVHFVEPARTVQATAATPQPLVPLGQTFELESRPGSSRVIYLDFTGQTVTDSYFNQAFTGGAPIVAAPFSLDGDVSTDFSAEELERVQAVWDAVAEDFAPFDVNVTTKDPGVEGVIRSSSSDTQYGSRVVLTQGGPIESVCSCSGLATLGTFDAVQATAYSQPAWVFTSGSATYDALTASHEVGHNFGLSHDGTRTSPYYTGAGAWMPIMGGGASRRVSQWSIGEYPDANRAEDDVARIAARAPLVADDHAAAGAGALTSLAVGEPVAGTISTRTDQDSFAFTASGGTTLGVTSASALTNLDVSLTIRDGAGTVVAIVDPPLTSDGTSGLEATWSGSLADGNYTATVDGVGSGDPATDGYSDYASLGRYAIRLDSAPAADSTVTLISPSAAPTPGTAPATTPATTSTPAAAVEPVASAPSRMQGPGVVVRGREVTVQWAVVTAYGSPVTSYLLDLSTGRDRTIASGGTTVLKRLRPGRYKIRIAARSAAATSRYSTWVGFRIR